MSRGPRFSGAGAGRNAEERQLTGAAERYGGPLLPGVYEEWVLNEQARLAERFVEAVRQLLDLMPGEASRLAGPQVDHRPRRADEGLIGLGEATYSRQFPVPIPRINPSRLISP